MIYLHKSVFSAHVDFSASSPMHMDLSMLHSLIKSGHLKHKHQSNLEYLFYILRQMGVAN